MQCENSWSTTPVYQPLTYTNQAIWFDRSIIDDHLNGFSPLCISWCLLRPDLKVNACLLHMKHSSSTIEIFWEPSSQVPLLFPCLLISLKIIKILQKYNLNISMSAIMLFYFRCYNTLIIFGGHISTALSLFHSSCSAVAVRKAKGCGSSLCSTGAFNTYVLSGVKYQFKSVTFSSILLKIEDYILRSNIQCEISFFLDFI